MAAKLLTKIAALRSDERGTSLVEFAVTAPVFVLMLVGLGDVARGFSQKYALQQAVNRTIEMAQAGNEGDDNYTFLQSKGQEAAADAGDPNAVVVPDKWVECDGNKDVKKAWTDTCPDGQQKAMYISLTINSTFRPMFGSAGYPGAKADGTVPISAKASLRVQ